jgi:tetratricopeptide (TPR) repeat protein
MEARRAIGLDPDEASALAVLAWVHTCNARFRQVLELAEHAISANPSYVGAYMAKGRALAFSGEHREAEKALQTALRLSPRDPLRAFVLGSLSPCHYFAGEYEESAKVAELAIRDYPDYALPYRWLAAALGQLGRPEAAGEALRRALAASPASFDFFVRNRPLWFRVADHEHMLEGLYKAGWRE